MAAKTETKTPTKPPARPRREATDTTLTIADFKAVVARHTTKAPKTTPAEIRANLLRVMHAVPAVYSEDDLEAYLTARKDAVKTLLAAYLDAGLAKYPAVDDAMFDLPRYMVFSRKTNALVADKTTKPTDFSGEFHVHKCDMFLVVDAGDREVEYTRCTYNKFGSQNRINVVAMADSGPVPHAVMAAGLAARGAFMRLVGELYSDPELARLLPAGGYKIPEIEVAWIPAAGGMKFDVAVATPPPPRSLDPVLLLNVDGTRRVITTYDIPAEKSYAAVLREYTTGPVAAILDRADKAAKN
jgi:hypothetical protein